MISRKSGSLFCRVAQVLWQNLFENNPNVRHKGIVRYKTTQGNRSSIITSKPIIEQNNCHWLTQYKEVRGLFENIDIPALNTVFF